MKVRLEPSTPVGFRQEWRKTWSGREDSNLRPLPPENVYPADTQRIPVGFSHTRLSHGGIVSRFVHGPRFKLGLRPLSYRLASSEGE